MNMRQKYIAIMILLLVLSFPLFSQSDYESNFLQGYMDFERFFQQLSGDYGTTFFPFLTMGYGGREVALSRAYTGVADDIVTLEANPAGTASLNHTQLFFSHNKLMGDVNYNTLAYSMRIKDLGFGVGARVLYMPFTHFDKWGSNAGSAVITYSVITFNVAYNFFRTYDFFGLSVGGNGKLYIYGVPETLAANQTKVNVAFDLGLLTKFNFLKVYKKVEKNFSIGITASNLGPFTDNEPPPTELSVGIGYKPLELLLISVDFNYLINYSALTYKNWSVNTGIEISFNSVASILVGATIKSSPSFSLGLDLNFENFSITAVYNPDFIDVSRFSISASLKLGDFGRATTQTKIKMMYVNALKFMNDGNYYSARDLLIEILEIDKTYSPAIRNLEICKKQIKTQNELNDVLENKVFE